MCGMLLQSLQLVLVLQPRASLSSSLEGDVGGPHPQLLPGAQGLGPPPEQPLSVPSWRLLSRCFRAWQHVVQTRQAVVAALALGRRKLLRRGLRALRWALWLREAQLEVAWGRHTQALLARSFQKVRGLQVGPWGGDETLLCLGRRLYWGLGCTSWVTGSGGGGCQPRHLNQLSLSLDRSVSPELHF